MEMNLTTCSKCQDKKIRIVAGYWRKNKRYVDDLNRLWNGKICPDCTTKLASERMKSLRARRKERCVV